jgi:hypothetical protein
VGEMRSDMQSFINRNRGKGIRWRNSVHREVLHNTYAATHSLERKSRKEWQTVQVTSMQVLGCVQSLVRRSRARGA